MSDSTDSRTGLSERRRNYHPADTAEVRSQTVSEIVNTQVRLLERAPQKTPLTDTQSVQITAKAYMRECADIGVLPNAEGLAAALGYSRRGLYDYLEHHGDTPTAEFIDRLRTLWAGMRQMAADRGAVDATTSIFVLLNSSLGFTNEHKVTIAPAETPLQSFDSAEARNRIIEAMPLDDDEM